MSGHPDELKLWVRSQICRVRHTMFPTLYFTRLNIWKFYGSSNRNPNSSNLRNPLYFNLRNPILYIWQVSPFYDGSSNRNLNWSNPRNPCLWICLKLRRLTSRTQFVTRKRMSSSSSSPLPSPSILFSASHELIKLDLSCFKSGVCRHNLTTRRIWDDLFLQIGPFQGIY